MKQTFRTLLFAIIGIATVMTASSSAQTVTMRPAVAFVTSHRDAIYIKQSDSSVQVLLQSIPNILTISHVALLGSDAANSEFLVGGNFTYLDVASSRFVTYTGVISIPRNFDPLHLGLTQIKFLKRATTTTTSAFRPVGAVTADGKEWFAIFNTSSSGNVPVFFYHGLMANNETDPGYVVDSIGPKDSYALDGGYHFSNVSLTPDGKMITTSVDHLSDDSRTRYQLYIWRIHDIPASLSVLAYESAVKGLTGLSNVDSNFAYTVRAIDNHDVEVALANLGNNPDNTIQFFKSSIDGTTVDLTQPTRSIPRSAIPSDMNFFCGSRGTIPGDTVQFNEVDPYAAQFGTGGDVAFSQSGDTAIFVTHEAPDDRSSRLAKSAIYMYDFNSGTATLVYNDTNALELQPVFITMPFSIPQADGRLSVTKEKLDFGTVDTGKTAMLSVTLTNGAAAGAKSIIIDSVNFTGPNVADFTVSGGTFPATVAVGDAGVTLNCVFTSTAPAGTKTAGMRIYVNGSSTPSGAVAFLASSNIPDTRSVSEYDAQDALQVSPNPFVSTLQIALPTAGSSVATLHLYDGLGRDRYQTSQTSVVGGKLSFTLDAQQLKLSPGVYYVSVTSNGKTSFREVVLK